MSIEQRTILEIILGLYRIESKYTSQEQMGLKERAPGRQRRRRQYIALEEYDDEVMSSDDLAESLDSPTLTR